MEACFDTNFLIYSAKQGIDFVSQLKNKGFTGFFVTNRVLEELEKLSKKLRGREKISAAIALEIVRKTCEIVQTEAKTGDESVLEACMKRNAILFTNDRLLRKKARNKGIRTGYIRAFRIVDID